MIQHLSGRIQNRISKRHVHTHIHCNLIHIAKRWKEPKCPPTDGGIMKKHGTYYIHAIEYYSTFKKKEILIQVTTWMNLEDTLC